MWFYLGKSSFNHCWSKRNWGMKFETAIHCKLAASFLDDTNRLMWGLFDYCTYYRFRSSFALWVNIQWKRNTNTRNTKARKLNGVKKEARQLVRGQIYWSKTSLLPLLLVSVTCQFDFLRYTRCLFFVRLFLSLISCCFHPDQCLFWRNVKIYYCSLVTVRRL